MCTHHTEQTDALMERLFLSTISTLELFGVYLGKEMGLYRVLHERGATTSAELANAAQIDSRYAREWLEQQAVAGFLVAETTNGSADSRRFHIPNEHVAVLVDDTQETHVAPFAHMVAGIGGALSKVVDAYRSGSGVAYADYGAAFRHGQGGINKPAFLRDLVETWIPSIGDIHQRLVEGQGARIADVGCGEGWSTIALARAYPAAEVVGYDLDAASIIDATENALAASGAANGSDVEVMPHFVCGDAGEMAGDGPFDLILLLETLHDMAQPTTVLAALRQALSTDGSVIIADERVAETFTAPGGEIERMMYGWSIVHCLPVAMADQPSEAIGTAIRPDRIKSSAMAAGFTRYEILPIENDLFRFYRLRA